MPDVTETTTTATVSQASPLRVIADGAAVSCPALVLDGATYTVGARVTLTVRNPQIPVVQGVES